MNFTEKSFFRQINLKKMLIELISRKMFEKKMAFSDLTNLLMREELKSIFSYEILCLTYVRMPLLTSWVGRNKIPYPVGTILSLMAREGTKSLPLAPSARGEDFVPSLAMRERIVPVG